MKYVGNIAEILAFIVSLIVLKKNKGSFIQWMSLYLFYTVCNEIMGYYLHYYLNKPTTSMYLWYYLFETIFYAYIFQNLLKHFKPVYYIKWLIWVAAAFIVVCFLFGFFFIKNYVEYDYKLLVIQGIYFCVLSTYYLYREFANYDFGELLIKKTGFWIASGILLFYSAMSIIFALHPMGYKNNIYIWGLPIHLFFASILSVILYACFSVAMIVWKPTPKI